MAAARRQRYASIPRHGAVTVVLIAFVTFVGGGATGARAQIGSERYSSIVVEAGSGQVLESANPDARRHPASLAKLMTLYMAFEALRDRRIALDQLVPVSAHAASMAPTKLGLVPGTRITVDQAILGLVTKSANDAAAALGEMLGGSEDRFAQMMTLRARALGMTRTTFTNASGLPDPDQWTTARDMAVLARRLIGVFPTYYRYFSTPSFVWQGRVIANHDNLLRAYPGADGMKTGYTQASGYNLVSSAMRGGVRLVGVVLGAGHAGERDGHMMTLLDQSFEQLDVPTQRGATPAAGHGLISSAMAAPVARPPARGRAPATAWGVQVGTHPSEKAARTAAVAARRLIEDGVARAEPIGLKGKTVWRAQVTGLSQADARDACAILAKRKTQCAVLRTDARETVNR